MAAEDLLSREPQSGEPGLRGMWVLPMALIGNRAVWLFYTFDEETVTFVAILPFDE